MDGLAVMGGGALGMLLAGKIAAAGLRVSIWTRTEEQATLLRQQGLLLEEPGERGDTAISVEAASFDTVPVRFAGLLVVALKQTAVTDTLLAALGDKLAQDAEVLLMQNGIGHAERFAAALPGRRIAVAVTTEGALRTGAASVRHTGEGGTWIGSWTSPDIPPRYAAEVLKKAGFSVYVSNSIRERMLRKLLVNAVINPLTALWRVTNGELPASPERRAVMEALFAETLGILRRHGYRDEDDRESWEFVLEVCRATAGNRSSMLQDVLAGRETEIDALNGAVCRLADDAGAPAPWNRAVTALVKAILLPEENGE